jgi:hypothetical protein
LSRLERAVKYSRFFALQFQTINHLKHKFSISSNPTSHQHPTSMRSASLVFHVQPASKLRFERLL